MIASDVIWEVSVDLNDQDPGHEYTRWSIAQLHMYLREAVIDVSTKLRDLFTVALVVQVQAGADWQQACTCTSILRIVGESTRQGDVIRYLRRSDDIEANTWAGVVQRCAANPRDYTMHSYAVSSVNDSMFKIMPPVPRQADRYVLVECYKRPEGRALGEDVPDEVVALVKQWMLYRALSVDSENNPTIIELAKSHKTTYMELLNAAINIRLMEKRTDGNIRTIQKPAAS